MEFPILSRSKPSILRHPHFLKPLYTPTISYFYISLVSDTGLGRKDDAKENTRFAGVAVREEDGLQNEAVEDALHNCSSSSNQTYQDSRHIHDISRQPIPQWQFIPCLP